MDSERLANKGLQAAEKHLKTLKTIKSPEHEKLPYVFATLKLY